MPGSVGVSGVVGSVGVSGVGAGVGAGAGVGGTTGIGSTTFTVTVTVLEPALYFLLPVVLTRILTLYIPAARPLLMVSLPFLLSENFFLELLTLTIL